MGKLGEASPSECVREDGAILVTRGGLTIRHGLDMAVGVDVGV